MNLSIENRLSIDYLLDTKIIEKDDALDAIEGLQSFPKSLPPRYFYDKKGSELFEEICELPEYYPTRTEASILKQYSREIVNYTRASELVELGSGSSTKTRFLLDAYQDLDTPLYYTPVDVSGTMLESTARQLLQDYSGLKIQGKVATYDRALEQLTTYSFGKRIIIFLGSSIGNFTPEECDRFIEKVAVILNPGDYFLLGIDLQKPTSILEAAYNDSRGITAAFNLNMLQHLNNRFAGNFNLNGFKHQAIYNKKKHQIEMYLIARENQSVALNKLKLNIEIEQQEKILTEISRKFSFEGMKQYLSKQNLDPIEAYSDERKWFGLLLCQKTKTSKN